MQNERSNECLKNVSKQGNGYFGKKKREKKKKKQKTMNEHGIGNVSIVFVSETEKSW